MGGEFAQAGEWNVSVALPWEQSGGPFAEGVFRLIGELNRLQTEFPALHQWDGNERGFEWLNGEDSENSVTCFLRHSENQSLVVVLNFTPEIRNSYRIPVPASGTYREVFNSDNEEFGGSGALLTGKLKTELLSHKGRESSLLIDLPPLGALVLQLEL